MTYPAETLKVFPEAYKEYFVSCIQKDIIPSSEPKEKMQVHVIPNEVERVRLNRISEKLSEFTYLNKDADADMSVYNKSIKCTEEVRYIVQPNDAEYERSSN